MLCKSRLFLAVHFEYIRLNLPIIRPRNIAKKMNQITD